MKVYFLQRVAAYFIDILVVLGISVVFTFFIPVTEKYSEALENQENILQQYENKEINDEEYLNLYKENQYIMSKESMIFDFVSIIITIAYFGAYSYYNNGMTLGKKIMNLRIVDVSGKKSSYIRFLLRASLLHGPILSILVLLFLIFMGKDMYFLWSNGVNVIYSIFTFLCVFMSMFRKDGRGLHDLISGTQVVATK